jgi:hypothetical protein
VEALFPAFSIAINFVDRGIDKSFHSYEGIHKNPLYFYLKIIEI